MYIYKVKVKNFRLLLDTELSFEQTTTLIVGRNNSGKTSLSEVIRRFLTESTVIFHLEDFSISCYDDFYTSLNAFRDKLDENIVRGFLPFIELRFLIRYDQTQGELGALAPFIVDLDPSCNEASIVIYYELKDGGIANFFDGMSAFQYKSMDSQSFFRLLRERIPKYYITKIWAEDPNDPTNRRLMTLSDLRRLLKMGFINAQRGLDDVTIKESDVLAKILERLFSTATSDIAEDKDKIIIESLVDVVQSVQEKIDHDFKTQLEKLLPALNSFGYPGLGGQELQTETILDVKRLLSNFTKVRYTGYNGITFPETYNGLGIRNLIFILLQIVGFYKEYRTDPISSGVYLIFIEEPEAHLHPQMQEVFIRQLSQITEQIIDKTDSVTWPVQFVVSTHSSHIANEVSFESIRYFLSANIPGMQSGARYTKIKDLGGENISKTKADRAFLHQYLTLTRCDLFFADKAIIVEGVSERLLLPVIIKKIEIAEPNIPKLSSQYNTIMEISGAYAHIFFHLLEFLELYTLVITDIDAIEERGGKGCCVHSGKFTSNACIKNWFSDDAGLTLEDISKKEDSEKIKGKIRIAFQCPEENGGPCGRTFEDAFILANKQKFNMQEHVPSTLENEARDISLKYKKSEFALYHAINDKDWIVPKYITDGIYWLASCEKDLLEHSENTLISERNANE